MPFGKRRGTKSLVIPPVEPTVEEKPKEPTPSIVKQMRLAAQQASSENMSSTNTFHDIVMRGSLVAVKRELQKGAPIDLPGSLDIFLNF